MSKPFAYWLGGVALLLAVSAAAQPPDIVTNKLYRGSATADSTVLRVIGATGKDTTNTWGPLAYNSISCVLGGDSVKVYIVAQAGNDTSWVRVDSLAVTASGKVLWQPSVPVSRRLRFIFRGFTANGAATVVRDPQLNRTY